MAKASDRAINQTREFLPQAVIVQPVFGQTTGLEIFNQDVRIAEQTLEALNYDPLTTTALEAPLLFELAAGRGITEAEMATRILANRQAFKNATAHLLRRQSEIVAMDPIPADYADDSRWT